MSAPIEMTANVVPVPPPQPVSDQKSEAAVRDRPSVGRTDAAVEDAAAVRAERVTMVAEELTASPEDRISIGAEERLDVWV